MRFRIELARSQSASKDVLDFSEFVETQLALLVSRSANLFSMADAAPDGGG